MDKPRTAIGCDSGCMYRQALVPKYPLSTDKAGTQRSRYTSVPSIHPSIHPIMIHVWTQGPTKATDEAIFPDLADQVLSGQVIKHLCYHSWLCRPSMAQEAVGQQDRQRASTSTAGVGGPLVTRTRAVTSDHLHGNTALTTHAPIRYSPPRTTRTVCHCGCGSAEREREKVWGLVASAMVGWRTFIITMQFSGVMALDGMNHDGILGMKMSLARP